MPTIGVRKKKIHMNTQFVCAESLPRQVCLQWLLLDKTAQLRGVPQGHRSPAVPVTGAHSALCMASSSL